MIAEINAARDYASRLGELALGGHKRRREAINALADIPDDDPDPRPLRPLINAPPPGWITVTKSDRKGWAYYDLHPDHAATVRRVFKMYEEGLKAPTIAATLNREKVPVVGRPRGKWDTEWRGEKVALLLRNDAVLGFFQPGFRDPENFGKQTKIGRRVKLYPPVIEPATWVRVQDLLDGNKKQRGRRGDEVANLFTGRLFCGTCGGPLRVDSRSLRRRKWNNRKFQCARYRESKTCDDNSTYLVSHFERQIVNRVAWATRIAGRRRAIQTDDGGLERLEIEISEKAAERDALRPLIARNQLFMEDYVAASEKLALLLDEREKLKLRASAGDADPIFGDRLKFLVSEARKAFAGDVEVREKLRSTMAMYGYRVESCRADSSMTLTIDGQNYRIPSPEEAQWDWEDFYEETSATEAGAWLYDINSAE